MTDRSQIFARIVELIEPFNEKGVTLGEDISFARDLELDSLKVMDLVASIEDEWDITLPLNMLPELETIGQLADAVAKDRKSVGSVKTVSVSGDIGGRRYLKKQDKAKLR